jgi:hypothetical protein
MAEDQLPEDQGIWATFEEDYILTLGPVVNWFSCTDSKLWKKF